MLLPERHSVLLGALLLAACAGSSSNAPSAAPEVDAETLARFPVTIGEGHLDYPAQPQVYALPGNENIARVYVARLETERLEQMVVIELREAMPDGTPVLDAARASLSDYREENPDAEMVPAVLTEAERNRTVQTPAFGTAVAYRLVESGKVHDLRIVVARNAIYRVDAVSDVEPGPLDERTTRFINSLRLAEAEPTVFAPAP